jgi:hypothetical protein
MKKILVLDGGGVKGISTAVVLNQIEKMTGRPICDTFDLIVGSSVGAILGAALATGKHSAGAVLSQMLDIVPKMFKRRQWPLMPKYSRDPFEKFWVENYGRPLMRDCETRYLCTSVDMCSSETHYFKSWEHKDGALPLMDAVERSFAAPVYFGAIPDADTGHVWMDGGVGGENCPVIEALIESVLLDWAEYESVHILSLGTGSAKLGMSFAEAKKAKWIKQALYFIDAAEGGLARRQSTLDAVGICWQLVGHIDGYSFQRIDVEIPKKIDVLDGVKFIDNYYQVGLEMAAMVNYDNLRDK